MISHKWSRKSKNYVNQKSLIIKDMKDDIRMLISVILRMEIEKILRDPQQRIG